MGLRPPPINPNATPEELAAYRQDLEHLLAQSPIPTGWHFALGLLVLALIAIVVVVA